MEITNLTNIYIGVGPRNEYYLFVRSDTLDDGTMIPLQASSVGSHHRKVLEAWVKEQMERSEQQQ